VLVFGINQTNLKINDNNSNKRLQKNLNRGLIIKLLCISDWFARRQIGDVAVGLRLILNICVSHICRCGALVDARGLHCFVCKRAPGRTSRHHALNDMVARAFTPAGVPAVKEHY